MPDQITSTKTRTFKGVDIGVMIFGLIAAGGLAYAVVQMTGEGGGGGGGGGSTTNTTNSSGTTAVSSKASPLKLSSITGASVVVNNDGAKQTFTFQSGSTVLGTVNNTGVFTAGTILSANQDVTLKFEAAPANDQMVVINYRGIQDATDQILTLCVGTSAKTTLFVGTDGSTYDDNKLKKRTTSATCGSIRSRALRPTHLEWGEIAVEFSRTWSQINRFNLYRGESLIAWFTDSSYQDETTVVAEEGDPLRIVATEFGTQLANDVVSPRAVLTITTAPRYTNDEEYGLKPAGPSWPVCLPEVAYNITTRSGYKIFYFDTNGTPYSDIFLQTKAMSGTCSGTVQKALRFSRTDTGSIAYGASSTWNQYGTYKIRHNGGMTAGAFNSVGQFSQNQGLHLNTVEFLYDPVSIRPFYAYSLSPVAQMTYPRAVINLGGVVAPINGGPMQPITASLCYPEQVVELPSNIGYFYTFYDTEGNPYRDVFLEQPLSCDRTGLTPQ